MARTKKQLSEEEIIADFDDRVESGRDLEGFTEVPGRVSKKLSVVYSLRLSPDEYKLFEEAAQARGMRLSDFLRASALGAVEGTIDAEKAAAMSVVKEKVRELSEAVSHV